QPDAAACTEALAERVLRDAQGCQPAQPVRLAGGSSGPGHEGGRLRGWYAHGFPTCHREALVYNVAAMPAEPSTESVPSGAAAGDAVASAPLAGAPRTERQL